MNRPGLMMYGQVVMSPGRVDTTGTDAAFWIAKSNIFCDGNKCWHVIAYDENAGTVLTHAPRSTEPFLQLGVVTAVPSPAAIHGA
jgi:hypothetical protein